ncbi:hypothetical protein [Chryseobacterium jejuense]|uniref:hypothetical protein n=1 Tax=Chryseobacterium jejuense TaxID=445960 RepID=UPI001D7AD27C|nr:hypothetical protein [Chryseobacterium jejuense]MBP2619224.1 hypothetical protein [Chryseobacterium jejuense]
MKTITFLRFFSIISYLFIILMGQMMGLPFICWLLFTMFDIGNIDQIFAILGVLGIILNFTKWKNKTLITILSFLLMLSPLIGRMIQVPIESFDYAVFKIPLLIFIIGYSTFIVLNVRNNKIQTV